MKEIELGIDGMKVQDLVAIAREGSRIRLAKECEERIAKSRRLVERWLLEGRVIYGVTTGFGALSDVVIAPEAAGSLQENILLSHSAGVGDLLSEEEVRAMMALRVKDLARGHSGIRIETVRMLIDLLNRGVAPAVPEKGSVGASGDLAPQAHMGLVLIGQGEAFYEGAMMSGAEALEKCAMTPLRLEAGEGLALVNGTQMSTAIGGLAVYDAGGLAKLSDIAAAMSLEVLLGSRVGFDPRDPPGAPSLRPGSRSAEHARHHAKQRYHIIAQRLRASPGRLHAKVLSPGSRGKQRGNRLCRKDPGNRDELFNR